MKSDSFIESSSLHAGDAEAESHFVAKVEAGNRLNCPKRRRQSLSADNAFTFALAVQHQIPLDLLFITVHMEPLESITFDHFESWRFESGSRL